MDKSLENNPLVHEVKNNNYRYYHNFIYWNYGFLPQTLNDKLDNMINMVIMILYILLKLVVINLNVVEFIK